MEPGQNLLSWANANGVGETSFDRARTTRKFANHPLKSGQSARTAATVTDTGWWAANAWSQPGIAVTGTKAEDANTSGAMTGNAAAWAVSGSPVRSPTVANTQDSA